MVGTVAKAILVHLHDHGDGPLLGLQLTLRQQGELGDLGAEEQHRGAVGAGGGAGAATDAGRRVHGLLGHVLRDEDGVAVLGRAGVDGNVPAGGDNAVQSGTIDDQVLDDREALRTEGLDDDGVAILEPPHVQLAQGRFLVRTVGGAVDHGTTHAADTFAAVVVKGNGLESLDGEPFVQHVDHFQEGTVGADVLESMFLESALSQRTILSPYFYNYIDRF